jgi:hypothetical protein
MSTIATWLRTTVRSRAVELRLCCRVTFKLNDLGEGYFSMSARLQKKSNSDSVFEAIMNVQTNVGIASLGDTFANDLMGARQLGPHRPRLCSSTIAPLGLRYAVCLPSLVVTRRLYRSTATSMTEKPL